MDVTSNGWYVITNPTRGTATTMQDAMTVKELPPAALLSNGRYDVVIDADGGGHAAYDDRLLTPRLGRGTRLYVQEDDVPARLWSAGSGIRARKTTQAALGPGCYRIRSVFEGISVTSDICVVPDRDAELRRYTVANEGEQERRLTLTAVTQLDVSAGPEWVRWTESARSDGWPEAAGEAGPRRAGISIETEFVDAAGGVLAERTETDGTRIFLLHAFLDSEPYAHETDGEAFFGPACSMDRPPGLLDGLTGTTGSSRSPILALQTRMTLAPGEERALTLAGCAGRSRESVIGAVRSLADKNVLADAFLEAALREQRTRDQLKLGPRNADRYHRVAAAILRNDPALRVHGPEVTADAGEVEPKLGLDPTRPLAVCRISDESEMHVARLMLKARAFWQTIGLSVQVLFLNDKSGAGANTVQHDLHEAIELAEGGTDGIVLRHSDVVPPDDQRALQAAAQLVLTADRVDLMRVES